MAMVEVAWMHDTAYLVQSPITHPAQSLLVGVLFLSHMHVSFADHFIGPRLLVTIRHAEQAR